MLRLVLLTIPLLGTTPSVLLIAWGPVMFLQGQDNHGRCLIIAIVHILRHPVDVVLFSFLSVAAPQNGHNTAVCHVRKWLSFSISSVRTSGEPATDGFYFCRDHGQVMTTGGLFLDPCCLYHIDWVSTPGPHHCKGLAKSLSVRRAFFDLLIPWHLATVDLLHFQYCCSA
jgi:hypothetical protein